MNQMSKILASETKAVLGIRINVQSWRQMATGIALEKFRKLMQPIEADLADNGDDRDGDLEGAAMPDTFHWQSSHTPCTGNQVYGGTVNFQHGLTHQQEPATNINVLYHFYLVVTRSPQPPTSTDFPDSLLNHAPKIIRPIIATHDSIRKCWQKPRRSPRLREVLDCRLHAVLASTHYLQPPLDPSFKRYDRPPAAPGSAICAECIFS